jgi:tripartite-type tricarboxylate transporter receptor subunit TctC
MFRKTRRFFFFAPLAMLLCRSEVFAQQAKYPSRPIRILVPFPPGGAVDTIARVFSDRLARQLGQPIIVENRPGAGSRLAAEAVAKSPADGYTILLSTAAPITIAPALVKDMRYNVGTDLMPLMQVAEIVNVMVVNPDLGITSVKDFIEWGRKKKSSIRFGSSGAGSTDHLAGELFRKLSGLNLEHVAYKGGGPALIDLSRGDIEVSFATYAVALPLVRSKRIKVIAVTTSERQALLPGVPTIGETVPGFSVSNWAGVTLPKGTPEPIADRLFAEMKKASADSDVRTLLNAAGIDVNNSRSIAEFQTFVAEETKLWKKVVLDANIEVE